MPAERRAGRRAMLAVLGLSAQSSLVVGLNLPTAPSFNSLNNFRDIGSIPCRANTRVVRPGLIYRAATPAAVTPEDANILQQCVRTIIDLRSEKDAASDDGPRLLAAKTRHVGTSAGE